MDKERMSDFFDLSRYEDALAAADKLIELYPQDKEAHFLRGNALENLNIDEGSLEACEEALKAYDKAGYLSFKDILIEKLKRIARERQIEGNKAFENKDYEKALNKYNAAIKSNPIDDYSHFGRGNALSKLGHDNEALVAYDEALGILEKYTTERIYEYYLGGLYNSKGEALGRLKRDKEALECYKKAAEIFRSFAYEDFKDREYERAVSMYKEAIKSDPSDAQTYNNLGATFHSLGRLNEALDAYDQAATLYPQEATIHKNRGDVLCGLGRKEEAENAYDQAIKIDPQVDIYGGTSFIGRWIRYWTE
jgi:tetratricopeptide (TPR) repeat protein